MNRRTSTPKPEPGATTAAVFGELLKHLREAAGHTQETLGKLIPCDRSQVARVESATRVPKEEFVTRCDEALSTGGMLMRLWVRIDWYQEVERPDWFKRRVAMEQEAVSLRGYESHVVMGLFQTEDYARALFSRVGRPETEERVRARMSRQKRFLCPDGPMLIAVLDESCIRNVVGNHRVMHGQCAHLLSLGQQPNICIQVAPAHNAHLVRPKASMSILRLPDGHEWIYTESLHRGHFNDDPAIVTRHSQTYDVLRADALSASESAALIGKAMKGYEDEDDRPQRGYLDQEQPQRRRPRRLHRSSPRYPRPRPRPRQ
ncbi:helix-turn-helix transcriptional regulator [Streptomyces sp. NPDC051162]|uniref:helix-turn-helix domain-containing protein n=1 Tax=unclassified Streptomyces TaxID=2593676 RepID=UPI00341BFBB8